MRLDKAVAEATPEPESKPAAKPASVAEAEGGPAVEREPRRGGVPRVPAPVTVTVAAAAAARRRGQAVV